MPTTCTLDRVSLPGYSSRVWGRELLLDVVLCVESISGIPQEHLSDSWNRLGRSTPSNAFGQVIGVACEQIAAAVRADSTLEI